MILRNSLLFIALGWLNAASAIAQTNDWGKVTWLRGTVSVQCATCTSARTLQLGESLQVGDAIVSEADGEAHFSTEDEGLIALRSNSEFSMERFQALGKGDDAVVIRLQRGTVRSISGWVGKRNREAYRIETPYARLTYGTDHETYVLNAPQGSISSGTYEKVNKGSSVIQNETSSAQAAVGKTGYAASPALLTPDNPQAEALKKPYLIKTPALFLPASNENAVDQFSQTQDSRLNLALAGVCLADNEGRSVSGKLDEAIQSANRDGILGLFDADATIGVRYTDPNTQQPGQMALKPAQFAQNTLATLSSLGGYAINTSISAVELNLDKDCTRARVRRHVIETGTYQGGAVRVESKQGLALHKVTGKVSIEGASVELVK
jgi:hypothetical protein